MNQTNRNLLISNIISEIETNNPTDQFYSVNAQVLHDCLNALIYYRSIIRHIADSKQHGKNVDDIVNYAKQAIERE